MPQGQGVIDSETGYHIFAKFFVSQKFRHLQCMRIYKMTYLGIVFQNRNYTRPRARIYKFDEVAYVPVTFLLHTGNAKMCKTNNFN